MAVNNSTFISKIIAAALALLGFASCDSNSDGGGTAAPEYGVPTATFRVTGRVVDKQTSEPIEGIRTVLVRRQDGNLSKYEADTLYTSASGAFDLKVHSYLENPVEFLFEIKDVDGEANGSYATKETDIVFENPDFNSEALKELGNVPVEQITEQQ